MIVKRIGIVLRLMDGLTGSIVDSGTVRIIMSDGAAGIRKSDGYTVFWDNGESRRHILLESSYYEREEVTVEMEAFRKRRTPVLTVWMKPGRNYPYPSEIRIKEVAAHPNSIIRLPAENSDGIIQLQADYPMDGTQPDQIQLLVPEELELEGRMLHFHRKSDGYEEYVTIRETINRSLGIYEMEQPLKEEYRVFDEEIRLVLSLKADKDGICRIPVL